ncbi:MAG: hypothetical protein LBT47_02735 [Deltaproteobacteria bacterium]|nr:hypothetical protein [Deltaproteobacteria bacterium]
MNKCQESCSLPPSQASPEHLKPSSRQPDFEVIQRPPAERSKPASSLALPAPVLLVYFQYYGSSQLLWPKEFANWALDLLRPPRGSQPRGGPELSQPPPAESESDLGDRFS